MFLNSFFFIINHDSRGFVSNHHILIFKYLSLHTYTQILYECAQYSCNLNVCKYSYEINAVKVNHLYLLSL